MKHKVIYNLKLTRAPTLSTNIAGSLTWRLFLSRFNSLPSMSDSFPFTSLKLDSSVSCMDWRILHTSNVLELEHSDDTDVDAGAGRGRCCPGCHHSFRGLESKHIFCTSMRIEAAWELTWSFKGKTAVDLGWSCWWCLTRTAKTKVPASGAHNGLLPALI